MKKVITTILAFIYLGTSMGATVHLHYCMDKLVSWGFGQQKSNNRTCPFCGMAKNGSNNHSVQNTKGCCKDEQRLIKIEKDQKASIFEFSFAKQSNDLLSNSFITSPDVDIFSPSLEYPISHAPPFKEKVPAFIRNCIFRI